MKQIAINQAEERLTRARDAVRRIREAQSHDILASSWSEFLLASHGIYTKLEQGAKGCGLSEGWFGRKKHDRRTDELLKYLHHARNTDEHGLSGTMLQGAEFNILSGNVDRVGMRFDPKGNPIFQARGDKDAVVEITHINMLKSVTSQRGTVFMPPTQHLGQPVDKRDAKTVAALGLAYFESLLVEATQLPRHS